MHLQVRAEGQLQNTLSKTKTVSARHAIMHTEILLAYPVNSSTENMEYHPLHAYVIRPALYPTSDEP